MTRHVQPGARPAPHPDAVPFRDAMARIASAVHLVTTRTPQGPVGLTATAFASVSDAPPTVLVCLERSSRTLAAIELSGVFGISTLPADGQDLAEIFAGRRGIEGAARFASESWISLASGVPLLCRAVACFDCRLVDSHDVASHRLLIGEVVALRPGKDDSGLIYRHRRFEKV
jgi:flavin reductase (DIM6/NTAB) family NADH-FMN oxidoreductase RutF